MWVPPPPPPHPTPWCPVWWQGGTLLFTTSFEILTFCFSYKSVAVGWWILLAVTFAVRLFVCFEGPRATVGELCCLFCYFKPFTWNLIKTTTQPSCRVAAPTLSLLNPVISFTCTGLSWPICTFYIQGDAWTVSSSHSCHKTILTTVWSSVKEK